MASAPAPSSSSSSPAAGGSSSSPAQAPGTGGGGGGGVPYHRSRFGDTTLTKVFVGGLAWETASAGLHDHFRDYGEILEAVDHPFLPRLYGVAEGERWSCLLTEFCPGGDLHVLRQRQPNRRFSEAAVRYAGSPRCLRLHYTNAFFRSRIINEALF
jgi:serine/threonine protein kinase